jgi:hypothetical protein
MAEGEERKLIRNVENCPANYTTSYPVHTTLRTSKPTKQQTDTTQSNEESKKGRKQTVRQTGRGKENVPVRKKHHIIKTGPCNFESTGP